MGTPWGREVLVALLSVLLLVGVRCSASRVTKDGPLVGAEDVMAVGKAACADCAGENLRGRDSFKGLQVAIVCKSSSGKYEAQGVSALDKSGRFAVSLPRSLLDSAGRLKHECFAQLFDLSKSAPCPTHAHPHHFKIVLHPKASTADTELHLFTTATPTLRFSRSACDSAFSWPSPKLAFHRGFNPHYMPLYTNKKKRCGHKRRRRRKHRVSKGRYVDPKHPRRKHHHKKCSHKHRRRHVSKGRAYPKHPPVFFPLPKLPPFPFPKFPPFPFPPVFKRPPRPKSRPVF